MDGYKGLLAGLFWVATVSLVEAQGIALNSIGAVNQSMAGAGVAAPLDAVGALHWNPATLSGLTQSEASFGSTLALTTQRVTSRVGMLSGSDRGEPGVAPIPYMGLAEHLEGSPWTFGLGVYGVGGFRVNYPAAISNPVLTAQPPLGLGIGQVFAEAELMQIAPTVSYAVTESLSFGIAPTISLARIAADPLLLAAPDDANGDTVRTFPSGRGNRFHWGGGFQIGVYYIANQDWRFGASFKSPQWLEPIRFQTTDELGRPRVVKRHFDYPLIASLGVAFTGMDNVIVALDARYFDYGNTEGFEQGGYAADGSLAGLGWSSIMSVAVGVQVRCSDCLYWRGGYVYNQNPIADSESSFNIASPVINQHFVATGISWYMTDLLAFSLTYGHGFKNSIEGPIQTPQGPVPGSIVQNTLSINGLTIGVTFRH